MDKVEITHYSDILCIWAHISQIRLDELKENFAAQVEIEYHFFPVFGDIATRMEKHWKDRGGIKGYSDHVKEVVAKFEHISVHENVWLGETPKSSLPAHLYLCALRLAESREEIPPGSFEAYIKTLREAFFSEAKDISSTLVLNSLLEKQGLPVQPVRESIESGEAFAALSTDMQQAVELAVRSSPTLLFNEDRQRLAGNLGYRIIEANVAELLEDKAGSHAWC